MKRTGADSILVVGVGNRWRRDDGIGPAVAEALWSIPLENVTVEILQGDPLALLDRHSPPGRLILVDAVPAPRGPCRVHRFDARRAPLQKPRPGSSHTFSLSETLELGEALNRLPDDTVVYAVEGWDFSHGRGLSRQAAAAAQKCLASILRELRSYSSRRGTKNCAIPTERRNTENRTEL